MDRFDEFKLCGCNAIGRLNEFIKQSLRQLDTVSRLTLYLACDAAVAVVILLSVLTVIQSRPQAAAFAAAAVMLSLTILSCTLALIEARKSPMLTLGAKE